MLQNVIYQDIIKLIFYSDEVRKKAITKMATITLSGIRYIPIGLFFCIRINYNTPIATVICSLSDKQSFGF